MKQKHKQQSNAKQRKKDLLHGVKQKPQSVGQGKHALTKQNRPVKFGPSGSVPLTRSFLLSHDHILIIHGEHSLQQLAVALKKRDYKVTDRASLIDALSQHLGKALETRAVGGISTADADACAKSHCIILGINLNPMTYFVSVDKGPKYGSPEAVAFRQFWSGKSELRHAGGEVRETLVWPASHPTQRVVDWILAKQLACGSLAGQRWQLHSQLRPLLAPAGQRQQRVWSAGLTELNSALADLAERLTAIGSSEMPLGVTGLLGVGPAFRGACLAPAASAAALHECHLQLESSGKWPALLDPFRAMKALYCLRLARVMRARLSGRAAQQQQQRRGGGSGLGRVVACRTGLLVDWRGHRFYLRLALPREAALARQGVTELGALVRADCAESRRLERELALAPALAGALRGLAGQSPTHAETVRLCLRWLSCHLLLPAAIEPLAVELLCAHVAIAEAPCSALRGFLLFLRLLATHDFHSHPLIVNLNESLVQSDRAQIEADFRRRRRQLPPMFIACPQDRADSALTAARPDAQLLARVQRCARAALALLERLLADAATAGDAEALAAAFRPAPQSFDAILHLALPPPLASRSLDSCLQQQPRRRPGQQQSPNSSSAGVADPADVGVIGGFHWVEQLVRRLEAAHGDAAHFLADLHGGSCVAALLRRRCGGAADQQPVAATAELVKAWVDTAAGLVARAEVFPPAELGALD